MKNVILLHQEQIQHYRVSIYNYLFKYLKKNGYNLKVISNGIQKGNPYTVEFPSIEINLTFFNLYNSIIEIKPEAVILFVNLRFLYLFPLILYLKIVGIKVVYWGHGIDLDDKNSNSKNFLYTIEHNMADVILLYSDNLKHYIRKKYHSKIFIANNTLNLTEYKHKTINKTNVFNKYNIHTKKNIICACRIKKRKRIKDLVAAFRILNKSDIGLILIGSDEESVLPELKIKEDNIFVLGPLFGSDVLELLDASDIYCIPGAIGLSIVDALYCGLPVVTENVDHGPEIMYLKDGINGFFVPKDDIKALADKLTLLLDNDSLRKEFSSAAKHEIETNGHIDTMCQGFVDALNYALNKKK